MYAKPLNASNHHEIACTIATAVAPPPAKSNAVPTTTSDVRKIVCRRKLYLFSSYALKIDPTHTARERPPKHTEKTPRRILASGLLSHNQPKIPHATAAIPDEKIRSVKVSDAIRAPPPLSLPISVPKMAPIPRIVNGKKARYHDIP
jgi:hypothetical protein